MKKKGTWIRWAVLLIIIVLIAGWFVFFSEKTQSAAYTEVPVTEGDLTTYYNFDGLVRAVRVQTITAGEAGTVRTVYVTQNQQVRKGDRIYRLDGGETVESEIAGEVTGLFVREGDVIAAGETAAEIIDMTRLEVELDVDEYDIRAVTPGAAVTVSVLAADKQLEGVVSALNKNGMASGDLSYYKATVPMEETEGVYPGMQVSAKMLREHVSGAALLRLDALQFDEYNQPYVETGSADAPRRVDVQVGVSDGVYCQILSGVQAGDTVLRPSGMSMMELMIELDQKTR